jgi:hypothetical protein
MCHICETRLCFAVRVHFSLHACGASCLAYLGYRYTTPAGDRVYFMHFVLFSDLTPHAKYFYKVKSGSLNAEWSDVLSFRAPYADGPTKIDIFGDMGALRILN